MTNDDIIRLSDGNVGACDVLLGLAQREDADVLMLHLEAMALKGPSIWLGYKDYAGEDLGKFCRALTLRSQAMVDVIVARGCAAQRGMTT